MRSVYIKTLLSGLCLYFLLIFSALEAAKPKQKHGVSKKTRACGGGTDRIVGGRPAETGEFPYQVSLIDLVSRTAFCGGSVISSQWILSAAHCFSIIPASEVAALVGTKYSSGNESTAALYLIDAIYLHYGYNSSTLENDIALLNLSNPIQGNSAGTVQYVNLASDDTPAGSIATFSGWGTLEFTGPKPDVLQGINLTTITLEECQQSLEDIIDFPVHSSNLCTYNGEGEGICQGDSGGPLVLNGLQIGVASWGYGCGYGKPDVFTSVSYYRNWIWTNIGV